MAANIYKIIEQVKSRTGLRLAQAFETLKPSGYTEHDLATSWQDLLSKDPDLYAQGWYDPPPQGIISLFGKAIDGYHRICQSSFRPQPMWPGADRYDRDKDDIIVVYASPVHRQTNLIGDFGLSLYSGTNKDWNQ